MPSDHPERPSTLVKLADHLEGRFRKLNSLAERADAIGSRGAASELAAPRHSDHLSSRINTAGDRLRGEDATLGVEQTITFRRTALEYTPPKHLD
ncbi:hypothetical protein EDD16DRAFT_1658314 [Pisolithus croceorrhizus]|nr:hypothetical protein EDD16DRAFT_1658314 [Pisolithus croceorrhizus]